VYRGIDDGEIIVIPAKGHCCAGVYGDVKITIRVANTTDFKRKGLDLIYVKKIGLREALGGEFEFALKLLDDNTCTIKNKRGAVIEPNLCKTYAGMGLVRKEQRGNLLIRFVVDFPATVSEEQLGHITAAFG
jgi:DnaJ-class molecular chaperone